VLKILFVLFVAIPLVELWLLFVLADLTSSVVAILCVIFTGVVGFWLTRFQGFQVYGRIRESIEAQQNPTDALVDGLLILIAGVLLMTPGMLTDLVGFMLLIPFSRAAIRRRLLRYFSSRVQAVVMGKPPSMVEEQPWDDVGEEVVLEGELAEEDSDEEQGELP
jgi:UPF0716 protein FxsA